MSKNKEEGKTKEKNKLDKNKKAKVKKETILEVNEITKESIKAETKKMLEKEKKEKEKADRLRKEKIDRNIKKIFKGYDINEIVIILMWVFFAIVAFYINFSILRQAFISPALKVFVAEESLKEVKNFNIDKVDNININLESFDVSIRESETDEIIIRYSKKYDKKVKIDKRNKNLNIEEKNKIFKFVRFESVNNLMIIEIPKNYRGTLEIENKSGSVKLDKYKIVNEEENININTDQDFYKNFFNI